MVNLIVLIYLIITVHTQTPATGSSGIWKPLANHPQPGGRNSERARERERGKERERKGEGEREREGEGER